MRIKAEKKGKTKSVTVLVIALIISILFLAVSAYLAENKIVNFAVAVTLVIISTILVLISIYCLAKLDYKTGVYKCRKCGHVFKPTFKAYILGAHTITTRHLKCPECKEKSWCKRMPL